MIISKSEVEKVFSDLKIQANGKTFVGTVEATGLSGRSWSTINRAINNRQLKASQNTRRGKYSIHLRDLAAWILGYFE